MHDGSFCLIVGIVRLIRLGLLHHCVPRGALRRRPRAGPAGPGPGAPRGGAGKNFPRGAPRETPIFPNFPFLRGENYPPRVLVGIPPIL